MDSLLNSTGRAVIAILTLLGCAATIAYLIAYGEPSNSLHASALSWAFFLTGAILVSFGIGGALPAIIEASRKSPTS